jgi:hypothetical protein
LNRSILEILKVDQEFSNLLMDSIPLKKEIWASYSPHLATHTGP